MRKADHYLKELLSNDPRRIKEAMWEIAMVFENNAVDLDNKREILTVLEKTVECLSDDDLASFFWVIGKFNDINAVSTLRTYSEKVILKKDPGIGWQFLVSYENIVGNKINEVDKEVFAALNTMSQANYDGDETPLRAFDAGKIAEALHRFKNHTAYPG